MSVRSSRGGGRSDVDPTHEPGEAWVREEVADGAPEDAFVCGTNDWVHFTSCLGAQGVERDLQQGADVVGAGAEVGFVGRENAVVEPGDFTAEQRTFSRLAYKTVATQAGRSRIGEPCGDVLGLPGTQ